MPGITERTFRRWRDRLRDEGIEGLRDRRIGKPSSRGPSAHGLDSWGAATEEICGYWNFMSSAMPGSR
jgi:hypothetical protein